MINKLILLLVIIAGLNCLSLHKDVSCSATTGIVFINNRSDTIDIKIKKLGDPKQSNVVSIENSGFKLIPSDTFIVTVKYNFVASDECIIHRIFQSDGLSIEITNSTSIIEQKKSYPINDALNADYVNLDKLSGIVLDTIVIN